MKKISTLAAICLTTTSCFAFNDSSKMQQDSQAIMEKAISEKNQPRQPTHPGINATLPSTKQPEQRKPKPGEVIPMVKDALPRLQNLQKLVWLAHHRIATIQDWNKKSSLQNKALIIIESVQNDMRKAGLYDPALRQSPEALVYGWQQEGYANAVNVTYSLDLDTCKLAIEQSIQKLKARTNGIKGMLWRGKKPAQQLIAQLEQHCKLTRNPRLIFENSSKAVENAAKFNEIYKQLNIILQSR